MAGDWIKMRADLGDDPSVIHIANVLGMDEDTVVGKLHRLWAWADKHTTDGTAPAITGRWVDKFVSAAGFADAMVSAKWISFSEEGVCFPNFERHNGESAKRRSEATLRQRLSRANRDAGVTGVTRTTIPRPFVRHVLQRDNYRCVYCGTVSDEVRERSYKALLSIDHVVPESRGGSCAIENLATACRQCNNEKNDRTVEEWGVAPTFLADGVRFENGKMVADESHELRDRRVTREEKRREERKEEHPHTPALFDRFWAAYPKRKSKADAEKAFTALKPSEQLVEAMIAAIGRATTSVEWRKDGGQFIPYPATWLRAKRWLDEQDPRESVAATTSGQMRIANGFVP